MNRRRLPNLIKQTSRKLRKEQTDPEAILWSKLRNKGLSGLKYLRQHPILFEYHNKKRFIVADFYCHQAKLIIELDGGFHEKQKDYDKDRDQVVELLGLRVLRIKNIEIENDLSGILALIRKRSAPCLTLFPSPFLIEGEQGGIN